MGNYPYKADNNHGMNPDISANADLTAWPGFCPRIRPYGRSIDRKMWPA
jgi:hypothetical protein